LMDFNTKAMSKTCYFTYQR